MAYSILPRLLFNWRWSRLFMTAFRLQTPDCVLQDSFYYCCTHQHNHVQTHTHTPEKKLTNKKIYMKILRSKHLYVHTHFTHTSSHVLILQNRIHYKYLITFTHSYWCSHHRQPSFYIKHHSREWIGQFLNSAITNRFKKMKFVAGCLICCTFQWYNTQTVWNIC